MVAVASTATATAAAATALLGLAFISESVCKDRGILGFSDAEITRKWIWNYSLTVGPLFTEAGEDCYIVDVEAGAGFWFEIVVVIRRSRLI